MPGLKRIEHRYILFPLFFLFSLWVNVVTGDYPKKKKKRESYLFGKTNFSPREFASYYYTRGRAFN